RFSWSWRYGSKNHADVGRCDWPTRTYPSQLAEMKRQGVEIGLLVHAVAGRRAGCIPSSSRSRRWVAALGRVGSAWRAFVRGDDERGSDAISSFTLSLIERPVGCHYQTFWHRHSTANPRDRGRNTNTDSKASLLSNTGRERNPELFDGTADSLGLRHRLSHFGFGKYDCELFATIAGDNILTTSCRLHDCGGDCAQAIVAGLVSKGVV